MRRIVRRFLKLLKMPYQLLKIISFKIIRIYKPNKYPLNKDNKIFIHLGCGEINSPGYINVDGRFYPHIHHVGDITNLPFFPGNFADLIYTSHTLEHVRVENLPETLLEWRRILKTGGVLRIAVPDFDKIILIYNDNSRSIEAIWRPLLGGQDYLLNSHYSVFNKAYLTDLLKQAGFEEIKEWDPSQVENHEFTDWSSIPVEINGKKYPISLNLEAKKY